LQLHAWVSVHNKHKGKGHPIICQLWHKK